MWQSNSESSLNSAIYVGDVRHRRFAVKEHHFKYPLYMMWVDLAKPYELNGVHPWLGLSGFKALKFNQSDYFNYQTDMQLPLKQRALNKIKEMGAKLFEKLFEFFNIVIASVKESFPKDLHGFVYGMAE